MKLEEYKTHLTINEKLSLRSITEHCNNMKRFHSWATQEQYTSIDNLTYLELLNFIKQQKTNNIKVQTIKLRLNSISKYYEYLKHIGIIERNPTKKIKLKGELKTITQNILSYTELEQLYNQYLQLQQPKTNNPTTPFVKQRNNVLTGLLIWQGAISGEIAKMNLDHINLNDGTIYIPKCKRGASRELKLYPNQILQLYKYINEGLPQLQNSNNQKQTTNNPSLTPKSLSLFLGNIDNHIHHILNELKGINQKVHNASQLRTSIIIHWIKVYGKRQAQYMAGHKYIGSTEKFELQEIDGLTDTLLKHHPFS